MKEESLRLLRFGADELFINSLIYLKNEDYPRHYRSMSLSRALNHYFERASLLQKCNEFLYEGMRARGFNEKEIEEMILYGEQKAEFFICLCESGRGFLERKIEEQNNSQEDLSSN